MYSSYYVLFIIVLFLILNKILKISNNYKNKYIWDGNTIACPDCRENVELVSIKNNNIIQYFIYIRNESDIISNVIKTKGDWPDCQKIRQLWFSLPGMEVGDYYMDAGANIGICSFGMLNIGIKTIAVEPIPNNLHILTSSLLLNNSKWIKNFTLFQVGLGKEDETNTINIEKGNWGGSSLFNLQQNYIKKEIHIVKLDDLLRNFNHKIHLSSVDIQGYELFMLEGGREILQKRIIRHFYMEIWCETYRKFNISEHDIYDLFEKYNYRVKEKQECNNIKTYFDIVVSLLN